MTVRLLQVDVIPTCRELGIAIVAYSPLGRGFLTGNIRSLQNLHDSDVRFKISPRFQGDNFDKECFVRTATEACLLADTSVQSSTQHNTFFACCVSAFRAFLQLAVCLSAKAKADSKVNLRDV